MTVKLKKGERLMSICYISGPPWRKDIGILIGMGPVGHPWGTGETGEVHAATGLRLKVATVAVPKKCAHEGIAEREWRITKNGQRVKRVKNG
jgi:hypothetical protein